MNTRHRIPKLPRAAVTLAVLSLSVDVPALHGKGNPCKLAGTVATLAGADEPGERMIVTGTVYRSDGTTPAAGAIVYAYQTDKGGEYHIKPGGPRLQGWARTDSAGRYELRTIRPGAYPSRNTPAHVHFQLWDGGLPRQWNEDLRFQDDPLVPDSEKSRSAAAGRFAWVASPRRDANGVLHVTHDIRSKPSADSFTEVLWGLEACGLK
jgi:protocatechuate 3,4-dioxygenase beta subunit